MIKTRILRNTLYVTSPDAYLSLDGENVVVLQNNEEIRRVPLHNLEGIITFGYTGASPALMHACAERNVSLSFLSAHGRFLARVTGKIRGNVVLRKSQFLASENESSCIEIGRNMIIGKISNCRQVVERAVRDHAIRIDTEKFKRVSEFLSASIENVKNCQSLEQLFGLEGEAASIYFSVFNDMILRQKESFVFDNRNRRPPKDNVNALLSFTYTLLMHDTASALETVGLDPYVGFVHRIRPGRASLALDVMEELRPIVADRFVLTMINTNRINSSDFVKKEHGAVIMSDEARKTLLAAWQKKKQDVITHPFLGEKIEWGLVPFASAMLLARYLRGDLDGYPPFLWK